MNENSFPVSFMPVNNLENTHSHFIIHYANSKGSYVEINGNKASKNSNNWNVAFLNK